jgi:hypothetical protein
MVEHGEYNHWAAAHPEFFKQGVYQFNLEKELAISSKGLKTELDILLSRFSANNIVLTLNRKFRHLAWLHRAHNVLPKTWKDGTKMLADVVFMFDKANKPPALINFFLSLNPDLPQVYRTDTQSFSGLTSSALFTEIDKLQCSDDPEAAEKINRLRAGLIKSDPYGSDNLAHLILGYTTFTKLRQITAGRPVSRYSDIIISDFKTTATTAFSQPYFRPSYYDIQIDDAPPAHFDDTAIMLD